MMNKEEIKRELEATHLAFWNSAFSIPEKQLNHSANGKWSVAENTWHINLSLLRMGRYLAMPKEKIATMFGRSENSSAAQSVVTERYQAALKKGAVAPPAYTPEKNQYYEAAALLQDGKQHLADLLHELEKWEEEELDQYLCAHPLLGKLTAREILYFTLFHASYHHDTVRRLIGQMQTH